MGVIVALCLLGQSSAADVPRDRTDLEFARGVEEFAMASALDPARAIPEPFHGLIAGLGDPSWPRRDAAARRLQDAAASDPRWLFWGRHDPDPEVRLRCNAVLRRLYPCRGCQGTGQSRNWGAWPCWDCAGTATAWPYSMWD